MADQRAAEGDDLVDLYELLRYCNVALAALLTLAMVARPGVFLRASMRSRFGRVVVGGWVTVAWFGTAESLAQSVSPGLRIPQTTTMLLLSAVWLVVDWRDDAREQRRALELARVLPRPRARVEV
jgi:hypothetical protein